MTESRERHIWRHLLLNAWEEVPLWELTDSSKNYAANGAVHISPAISREELVPVLVEALRSGDMALYDRDDADKREIPVAEALEIVGDSRFWSFEMAPKPACLFLTDAGLARAEGARQHS